MKAERRWSITVPAIALAIPIAILFQNFSPADLNARNAIIRDKAAAEAAELNKKSNQIAQNEMKSDE